MGLVFPVFRWGFISPVRPGSVQVGPGHRFYSFAPTKVRLVSAGLVGKEQFTKNGLGGLGKTIVWHFQGTNMLNQLTGSFIGYLKSFKSAETQGSSMGLECFGHFDVHLSQNGQAQRELGQCQTALVPTQAADDPAYSDGWAMTYQSARRHHKHVLVTDSALVCES